MKNKLWVITFACNEYDQQGDYLEAVFTEKPTEDDLKHMFYGDDLRAGVELTERESFIKHLLNGGGRIDSEYCWYFLSELEEGMPYVHSKT